MTRYWGPLGWMALHSISINYPDEPTFQDKETLTRFLDRFRDTITCPSCQSHFREIYKNYIAAFPEWNTSKYNLFLFVARAHNTVNKRLDKPLIRTVADCLKTIKTNSQNTTLAGYRAAYITYLVGNWNRELSGDSMMRQNFTKDLQKINNEYWNVREVDINTISFPEGDVLFNLEDRIGLQRATLRIPMSYIGNRATNNNPQQSSGKSLPNVGFRITGGRLKLGNM
jgi:hypothetical protein